MNKIKSKVSIFALLMLAILITAGVVMATSNMNPKITYTGYGNPSNGTGKDGDLYVDLDTNVLWCYKNSAWGMFAIFPEVVNGTDGPIGPTGPQGEQGIQGIAGQDGKDGIDGLNGADGVNGRRGPFTFYQGILLY